MYIYINIYIKPQFWYTTNTFLSGKEYKLCYNAMCAIKVL